MNNLKKGASKICKIFIQKKIKWTKNGLNNYPIYSCGADLIHSLNVDLYETVSKKADGYFYSQSYWDRNDDSLLLTESYWENTVYWEKWLASEERKEIIKKYEPFIDVNTSYHVLIKKKPFEIPLL